MSNISAVGAPNSSGIPLLYSEFKCRSDNVNFRRVCDNFFKTFFLIFDRIKLSLKSVWANASSQQCGPTHQVSNVGQFQYVDQLYVCQLYYVGQLQVYNVDQLYHVDQLYLCQCYYVGQLPVNSRKSRDTPRDTSRDQCGPTLVGQRPNNVIPNG